MNLLRPMFHSSIPIVCNPTIKYLVDIKNSFCIEKIELYLINISAIWIKQSKHMSS